MAMVAVTVGGKMAAVMVEEKAVGMAVATGEAMAAAMAAGMEEERVAAVKVAAMAVTAESMVAPKAAVMAAATAKWRFGRQLHSLRAAPQLGNASAWPGRKTRPSKAA